MRTVNDLNQILSDLYGDLEKLQSSRNQVELVTESTNELTKSISILLHELKGFLDQSLEINDGNVAKLNQSLELFDQRLNTLLVMTNDSISKQVDSLNQQVLEIVKKYSNQLSESEMKFNDIAIGGNERIVNKIEEFERKIKFLVQNAESGIENIKNIAINNIKDHNELLKDQFLVLIDKFSKQIDLNEKFIKDINDSNKESLNRMLEEFEKLSNDILTKACENIDNIRTVAVESIDKQNQIIAKTVEGITNTNLVIEKLIKDLGGYRLLENLETIIHKLDRQEKVSKTNKLLLTILIIIFGFEFVFIIAKDYGIFNF